MKSVIRDIHLQLTSGECTCRDIVKEKISSLSENEYNSVNLLLEESAIALADNVDAKIKAGKPIGLLEGIPFGIKDTILLQGSVASGSSSFLKNYVSPYSATVVQKLMEAGAIPIVKENCDSFGHGSNGENTFYGTVKNAHDKSKAAGGSSSGSAVNVAKGYTTFSIGGDAGGALPAGFNKVYALKPAFGSLSRYGCMANDSFADGAGPIASTLEDLRILMNVMSGIDIHDNKTCPTLPIPENIFEQAIAKQQITVGYYKNFIENKYINASIKDAFLTMLEALTKRGIKVIALDSLNIETIASAYFVLAMAEASSGFSRLDGTVYGVRSKNKNVTEGYLTTRSENFTDETKRRIIGGSLALSREHDADVLLKARNLRMQIIDDFKEDFTKVDLLLSPVSTTLPPTAGQSKDNYMSEAFTAGFALGGLPTLTAPLFTPTGIQITANSNREDLILTFANYLEEIG